MGNGLDPKKFWQNMDVRLAQLGQSRPFLAEKAGIKVSTINTAVMRANKDPEDGFPTVDNAYRIAEALGVSMEFLVTGREQLAPAAPENPAVADLIGILRQLPIERVYEIRGALKALQYMPTTPIPGAWDGTERRKLG